MKQVFRRVLDKKGVINVENVPSPQLGANNVLIETSYTLISAGTEGATLSKTFPELVKQTLQDPWMREAVKKLIFGANPILTGNIVWDETTLMRAIGYSGSGRVSSLGSNVTTFKPGDRVAFAAAGHAEIVAPSKNFVVPIPNQVSDQEAAFVTVGGIALQGVRRAEVQLGELIVVYGLGLIGLLTAQIAAAAGANVIGIDISADQIELFKSLVPDGIGINAREVDIIEVVKDITGGHGADGTIICASSSDKKIANDAMKMCRKQGRVVFVGIVKMNLERMPFFQNELDIKFSRAYGPGVMEPEYEKGRLDYPYHYIRWTQQRNLAAFLELIARKKVNVQPLIAATFSIDEAQAAFDSLYKKTFKGGSVLLEYAQDSKKFDATITINQPQYIQGKISFGVIGAGNFTRTTHLPNLHKHPKIKINAIASKTGHNAASLVNRYEVNYSTSDYHEIINDTNVEAVLISTRHDTHCDIAVAALKANKHVMLEKPAALSFEEYDALHQSISQSNAAFMVAYNRRYSALAKKLKASLSNELPMIIHYNVAIPEVPSSHWTLDSIEGGGRLIGEAEHFFDFFNFLSELVPTSIEADALIRPKETSKNTINFTVKVKYGDHALCHLNYTSIASSKMPREEIIVHQANKTYRLTDFKTLEINGASRSSKKKLFSEYGHQEEINHFVELVAGGINRADPDILLLASHIALTAQQQLDSSAS